MSDNPASRFSAARLVVGDLQRQAAFYRAVFGLGEGLFIADQIRGRPIEELIFMDPRGGAGIILLQYMDGNPPSPEGAMLVFFDEDVQALEARLLAAGGSVFQPVSEIDLGQRRARMAIYADPEGFLHEVIEGK